MNESRESILFPPDAAPSGVPAASPYRVLARKYRPSTFSELIGQEALVRTLTNAIKMNRLAHAYLLTGVRGVGKTTTARIIARALNCVGPDGTGGATAAPCGQCEHCKAIGEDRHVDVIEMDAASRTGVDDMRELIDGVRYAPMSARYKVYIVDEVHMLSKSAFNALLKTLEEPPLHVVFVFATTEVRKVPITVLSRCQRFDLRRVDADRLIPHLMRIAEAERTNLSADALALIARAADGSVRDGLSLLDQAIATYGGSGADEITAVQIRDMLGLADRTQVFDLFEAIMAGEAARALALLTDARHAGADPLIVLQDLLELVHWVTRVKVVPASADEPTVPEAERVRGRSAAENLSMAELTRAWQMLLKGLSEVQNAPSATEAAEMVIVRLTYAATLPTPAEIAARLESNGPDGAPAPTVQDSANSARPVGARPSSPAPRGGAPGAQAAVAAEPRDDGPVGPAHDPRTFPEVVALFAEKREALLHANLMGNAHLVRFEPGRLEFRPGEHAPRDLANRVQTLLSDWTGRRWVVSVSQDQGHPTLNEQAAVLAASHPVVRAVLKEFPGAEIVEVRDLAPVAGANEASLDGDDHAPVDPEDSRS
jgi:DNA polymerase-3 subunit gamma/tau